MIDLPFVLILQKVVLSFEYLTAAKETKLNLKNEAGGRWSRCKDNRSTGLSTGSDQFVSSTLSSLWASSISVCPSSGALTNVLKKFVALEICAHMYFMLLRFWLHGGTMLLRWKVHDLLCMTFKTFVLSSGLFVSGDRYSEGFLQSSRSRGFKQTSPQFSQRSQQEFDGWHCPFIVLLLLYLSSAFKSFKSVRIKSAAALNSKACCSSTVWRFKATAL